MNADELFENGLESLVNERHRLEAENRMLNFDNEPIVRCQSAIVSGPRRESV